MSEAGFDKTELLELCWQQQMDELSPERAARLEHLVAGTPAACDFYLRYIGVCANLEWSEAGEAQRFQHVVDQAMVRATPPPPRPRRIGEGITGGLSQLSSDEGAERSLVGTVPLCDVLSDAPILISTAPPFPCIADSLPTTHYPLATSHFLSGWPVAYLIATVVFVIAMTVGAFTYVSHPVNLVQTSTPLPSPLSPLPSAVARITGMVDCVWESGQQLQSTSHYPLATNHSVSLGDTLALRSGLLEITYDTGRKVILQGPVSYEVESSTSGYLSVGKLTARLEKKSNLPSPVHGRGAGGEGGVNAPLSTIHYPLSTTSSPQSLAPSPSSNPQSLIPNPFAIRTPTATVTDLGTEFGVEVANNGVVRTQVFVGAVEIDGRGGSGRSSTGKQRVVANHVALVQPDGIKVSRVTPDAHAINFVRKLPSHRSDATLAFWHFEDDVPSPPKDASYETPQLSVVHDSSGHRYHLDYWPAGINGIGAYPASTDVPPPSMFHEGHSGGKRSFNSEALDATKKGVLFCGSHRHGSPFDFFDSFTIEGYFKTAGNQSTSGTMAILYKDEIAPAYMITLNRGSPGSAQFTVFGGDREISATLGDQNYADGKWHYVAARYAVAKPSDPGTISLLVADEDGLAHCAAVPTPPGFVLNRPDMSLFIGRQAHIDVQGHFRGLIDEIRISRGILDDTELLSPLKH